LRAGRTGNGADRGHRGVVVMAMNRFCDVAPVRARLDQPPLVTPVAREPVRGPIVIAKYDAMKSMQVVDDAAMRDADGEAMPPVVRYRHDARRRCRSVDALVSRCGLVEEQQRCGRRRGHDTD